MREEKSIQTAHGLWPSVPIKSHSALLSVVRFQQLECVESPGLLCKHTTSGDPVFDGQAYMVALRVLASLQ